MGEYFDPKDNTKHICDLPVAFTALAQGYRCQCGKAFLIKTTTGWKGVKHWERARKHDRA